MCYTIIGGSMIKKHFLFISILLILTIICILFLFKFNDKKIIKPDTITNYVSGYTSTIDLDDENLKSIDKIIRGNQVVVYQDILKTEEEVFKKIKYNKKYYYINIDNLVMKEKEIIKEKEKYVRTSSTIYKKIDSAEIISHVKKGSKVEIIGYDYLTNGNVNKYKIKYNDIEGYVYDKYLVDTKEDAIKLYDDGKIQEYMKKMGNSLGGGSATTLDFYPYEKPNFKENIMPSEVRALYINSGAVRNIDKYIDFAKENNINAFVIDIKDNTSPAYNSHIMEKYSKTNYERALNSYENYKEYIKKAKDAEIYLIGRITVFKDSYFVKDNKDAAISNKEGEPFSHNGSYWPSAFNRDVWEFNVELAREAVKEMGFNEIQFDYVRFPDRTIRLEKNGTINLKNKYEEEKAEAIQNFVIYACDSIHEVGAYVSIDVFGESANNYVTAYGQFWAGISNIADVISGMPYPDHFNAHEYGINEVVWTVPYKVLDKWSKFVLSKQEIIKTPAIVRTWIQTYNATRAPYVVYDDTKISEQIKALYDNGLNGGYMTWNSASNLIKYKEVSYAFRKVYE